VVALKATMSFINCDIISAQRFILREYDVSRSRQSGLLELCLLNQSDVFSFCSDRYWRCLLRGQVNDSLFKMMESSLQEKRNRNKLTPYQRFASIYLNRFNMEYTEPVKPNEQLK